MSFAKDLAILCVQAQEKCELVVRKAALELYSEMIDRSPVGNPDLWKDNAGVMKARGEYLDVATAFNEANPGKRRMGTSAATVKKKFPLLAGGGYVGGRFKNNWQVGIGMRKDDTSRKASASGNGSLSAYDTAIKTWKPGQTIWLTNSLPYSQKLEYGHSSQAPGGMVRLAVQNYAQAVAKAAREVKS